MASYTYIVHSNYAYLNIRVRVTNYNYKLNYKLKQHIARKFIANFIVTYTGSIRHMILLLGFITFGEMTSNRNNYLLSCLQLTKFILYLVTRAATYCLRLYKFIIQW